MQNVAQLDSLEKVYHKHKSAPPVHALRGINLTIPQGQYMALMGPSGSGKSTLMNIIGCLDQPTAGRYMLGGRDVAALSDDQLSHVRGRKIGFVFQAFNLIAQLTIQENVQVPLFYQSIPMAKRRELAAHALDRVGLTDRAGHRPAQLSGGQQQRAAIARALVTQPSLLLADEPTGNLDSTTGQAVLELFDELHQQSLTIIVVTHDQSVARRAERRVWLHDGEIERDEIGRLA